ncbi:MAG TPA: urea carboxylase [Candidatus Limnocylindrales bacterium]|nr:urea carboxylase [Candidatus Limnocylindrales bacterium]
MTLPRRVLIANRGEIACRVIRTLDRLGVPSLAVYADADSGARHVREASEAVRIGPAPVAESYLRADVILEVARTHGADAIHPGYGLLSENADFAAACEATGIAFLGPTSVQIRDFGLKHRARELASAAGVPVCPGTDVLADAPAAIAAASGIGYPVLLKATAGGGGIGMWLCHDDEELAREFDRVSRLAAAHFGSGQTFLEKFVPRARHIEVQIFGDGAGSVISLGERDCSLQRRRQKVFEECPAPNLPPALAARMHAAAVELGRSVSYRSAGTVEFLLDARTGDFYFLEVNTRLQVEHGVTEEVCGIDLVEWMIRLGTGDASPMHAYRHRPRGHAIEVRLYAEDPSRAFQPSSGVLTEVVLPHDVRIDGWIERGTEVSPFYDPLLAKVIAHGDDRAAALARLADALSRTRLGGLRTNLEYARAVAEWHELVRGDHHTGSLADFEYRPCAVEVIEAGAMTTVQDWPARLGYWHVGVPPSGPMDDLAFRIGNRILGNAEGTSGLELTIRGPTLLFHRAATVCITGATIDALLDGRPCSMWEPIEVAAGFVLELGAILGPGARTYLLVRGGLDVPEYLGSRSTFTLGRFGGHAGRALVVGDVLPLGDASSAPDEPLEPGWARAMAQQYGPAWELRVIDGPHANPDFFTDQDIETFYGQSFEVHYQSARTGVRLIGPKPSWARSDGGDAGLHPSNIHDTAYGVGSVDFTGDMPVILGPDGPSLGGFVCPAVVIHADLWKLGQLSPGDTVTFRAVSTEEATSADHAQAAWLQRRGYVDRTHGITPAAGGRRRGPLTSGVLSRRAATAATPEVTYRRSGDRYLLIEYGPLVLDIDLRIRAQLLFEALERARRSDSVRGIIDVTPGIRSVQVHYDPHVLPQLELMRVLEALEDGLASGAGLRLATRIVHLPLSWNDPQAIKTVEKYMAVVRDDAPWCPSNIEFIRRINGLESHDEVYRIVFGASYLVLGLGDVYLGAPVATPIDPRHRLVTTKYNPARTWTPENAVGIGGAYLCIYGMEGPGGYQLVGRTVPVWNTYERWRGSNAGAPWLLRFFDQIRFHPVEAGELLELRRAVVEGRHELRIEEDTFDVDAYHRFLGSIAEDAGMFRRRQQAAFAEERQRWVDSGEFEAARSAEGSLASLRARSGEFHASDAAMVITAPFGAQVWAMPVQEGQHVAAGEDLVVLSAMKTETAVPAPVSGTIEKLACAPGQIVLAGAPLLALLPDGMRAR